MPILVQNPQAIGVLRHIQSFEERLGFDLCTLQTRRNVRNAIEHGARIVLFANAEELYCKHHFCLGLAISKRIIEMHGGGLQPGQGSTFAFTLPVVGEQQVTVESPIAAASTVQMRSD